MLSFWLDISSDLASQSVVFPLNVHCCLGDPSWENPKTLPPSVWPLSYLECESHQPKKHHLCLFLLLSNKRFFRPFVLADGNVLFCVLQPFSRFEYFVTSLDDYSKVTLLYLMKDCSELFLYLHAFCAKLENQFNLPIRILRSEIPGKSFEPFTTFTSNSRIIH